VRFRLPTAPMTFVLALALVVGGAELSAQDGASPRDGSRALPTPRTAEGVYRAACITCHGPDGTGSAKSTVGFDAPLPDFTDCAFATAEADVDWFSVVHEGGPVRGLDRHMPAFGDALSQEEIALAVSHVRTFCREPGWPQGDLNLPRAFFTEKAFPENEVVWATAITTRGDRAVGNDLIYERRIGARNQIELVAPVTFQQDMQGMWNRGLGDIALGFKRVVQGSMRAGRIVAAGLEVVLPTGKEQLGLGNGYTIFEPFAMWGQLLPRNSFVQMHGGIELPSDRSKGPRELFLRTAAGTTLAQDRGFGRAWSPQVELLWTRPEHSPSEWDVVPQVQVSLSKIQHVSVAGGVRIPLSQREERHPQALIYLLWDWFDGGFFEFWK
jgi:mono/diheme cytochrome c family protein